MKLRIKSHGALHSYVPFNVVDAPGFGCLPDGKWVTRVMIPCPKCLKLGSADSAIEAFTRMDVAIISNTHTLPVELARSVYTGRTVEMSELFYQGRCPQRGYEVKILTQLIIGSCGCQLSQEPLSVHQ